MRRQNPGVHLPEQPRCNTKAAFEGLGKTQSGEQADLRGREFERDAACQQQARSVVPVHILPDRIDVNWLTDRQVSVFPDEPLVQALDQTLAAISELYGEPTTNVVAMQANIRVQTDPGALPADL